MRLSAKKTRRYSAYVFTIFAFAISITLLISCTRFYGELNPKLPNSKHQQLYPFPVTLCLSSEFKNREEIISWTDAFGIGEESYIYPIGKSSEKILIATLKQVFAEVKYCNCNLYSGIEKHSTLIIEADFSDVQIYFGRPVPKSSFAEISYVFRIINMDRDKLAEWKVTGRGEQKGRLVFSRPPKHLTIAIESAMTDSFEKLKESFIFFPEVRRAISNFLKENHSSQEKP